MQGTMTHRLSTLLLASASVAALSLAWVPSPALAEKVGVTSAVNPDALQRRRPGQDRRLGVLQSAHQH